MKSRFKGFLQSVHEFWGSNRDYSDDSVWALAAVPDRRRSAEAVVDPAAWTLARGISGADRRRPSSR